MATETAADLANQSTLHPCPVPHQLGEISEAAQSDVSQISASEQPTTIPVTPVPSTGLPMAPPNRALAYIDLYMDDFMAGVQGIPLQRTSALAARHQQSSSQWLNLSHKRPSTGH